jgi:acetylornithine aminotransferase
MVQGFEACTYNDIASLEEAVKKATSDGQGLAAIMLEPLQGEGGIIPGDPSFFEKARALCDEHGALLMIDEVQAGMGRTGTLWGHEQLGIVPDVFTSAKALGGGVPIGE